MQKASAEKVVNYYRRKICTYNGCQNNSAIDVNTKFILFPKPCSLFRLYQRHGHIIDKCPQCCIAKRWMLLCGRSVKFYCLDHINPRTTFVCAKHFLGGNGPTDNNPDPIPNMSKQCLQGEWMDEPGLMTLMYESSEEPVNPDVPTISRIKQEPISMENEDDVKDEVPCINSSMVRVKVKEEPEDQVVEEDNAKVITRAEDQFLEEDNAKVIIKAEMMDIDDMTYDDFKNKSKTPDLYTNVRRSKRVATNAPKFSMTTRSIVNKSKKPASHISIVSEDKLFGAIKCKKPEKIIKETVREQPPPRQMYLQTINKEKFATLPKSIQQMMHQMCPITDPEQYAVCLPKPVKKAQPITVCNSSNGYHTEQTDTDNVDSNLISAPTHFGQFDEILERHSQRNQPALLSYSMLRDDPTRFEFFCSLNCEVFDYMVDHFCSKTLYECETSTHNEIFITLTCLTRGYTREDLAHLFGISPTEVQATLATWIHNLFKFLYSYRTYMFSRTAGSLIHLHKYETHFPLALDVLTVARDNNTQMKFLLGIRAAHQIAYISSGVLANIKSVQFISVSDIRSLLTRNDLLIGDAKFALDSEYYKVITPLSYAECELKELELLKCMLKVKTQAVSKFKQFRLLNNGIPTFLVNDVNKIVFICGCLINYQWSKHWIKRVE